MTTNKFWIILCQSMKVDLILFPTEAEAVNQSYTLAEIYAGHDFVVMESIWSHRAVTTTINKVIETPLHEKLCTPKETSPVIIEEDELTPHGIKKTDQFLRNIPLETDWFFKENATKIIKGKLREFLLPLVPDNNDFLYSTSNYPYRVDYCHAWFELDDKVYNYYLNKELSNNKVTILSYKKRNNL